MGKNTFTQIEGTALADLIALGYTDGDGDIVSNLNDLIYAFGGNDIVHAAGGNDKVYGGLGNDTIFGGDGHDLLYGEDGNDQIDGGSGSDRLWGGDGNDLMLGGIGNDQLRAGKGNDTLHGGDGDDKLYGNKGNNEIYGEGGDDYISSGDQTSIVDGGSGDDEIWLRTNKGGDHTATGGTGADSFQFYQVGKSAISDVTITDFELGIDDFAIDGVDGGLYLTLLGAGAVTATGGGADTLVTLTTGDTITFEGITEAVFEAFYGL